MHTHHPAHRSAFTLVELLVVMGIIAVLISILLPSLAAARVAANRTQTLSNLRQIGMAMSMYENDYRGKRPTVLTDENRDGRSFTGLQLLAGLYELNPRVFLNPNTDDTEATETDPVTGYPVLADIDGVPITLTDPPVIDASNIEKVNWHCSFAYDHEKKRSGKRFQPHVYLGDRADYRGGRSMSASWEHRGLCLLWDDQHAEYVTSKALLDQADPNVYHHNQYYDDNGVFPGEGGDEVWDEVAVTPETYDTHLRFFSEEEDDALLPNP